MTKPVKILIVEVAIDLGKELKEAIRDLSQDLSITVAPSAEEGILEMGRHPIDLLVTDFRLPGISGLELVRRVRRKYPQVMVILTSAVLDAQFKKEAEDLQVTHYLQKPVDPGEFLKTVADCLGIEATLPQKPAIPPPSPVGKPAAEDNNGTDEDQLSKVLFVVHQSLKAKCTMWMDSEGGIDKAFGDLPADLPRDVVRNAAQAVATANQNLATLLLSSPWGSVHFQPGMGSDLLITSAVEGMVMAVFSPGIEPEVIGEKVNILQAGLFEIEKLTGTRPMQTEPKKKSKESAATPPAEEKDLERILGKSTNVTSSEADDFWNNAGAAAKPDLGNPDLLSYEQAKKMGLKIKKEDSGS